MKQSKRVTTYRKQRGTGGAGSANRRAMTGKQRRRVTHKSKSGLLKGWRF